MKLWKHHAAQSQADRINELAHGRGESWLPRYGGFISSEWEFAKGLHLLEEDRELYDRMDHWIEAADLVTWPAGRPADGLAPGPTCRHGCERNQPLR